MLPRGATCPPGHVRHNGRGLCRTCYTTELKRGDIIDHARLTLSRDDVVEEVRTLLMRTDAPGTAAALGRKPGSIARALTRAGRPDLARQFWRADWAEREAS